jgi:hypothetical protein
MFFVLTAIVYAGQLWTQTGVVLMVVAAAAWPIATVNAGFLGIGLEVATRRVHPRWLVLPLAWFGGYGVAAYLSQLEFNALDTQVRVHNGAERLMLNAPVDAYALVFKDSASDARQAVMLLDIPVAYAAERNGETSGYRAYRLANEATCKRLHDSRVYRDARYFVDRIWEQGVRVEGLCVVSRPEKLALPTITVTQSQAQEYESLLLQTGIQTLTISASSGEQVELLSGRASPLPWFPMPVFGCGLNSGEPRWECFHGFMRPEMKPIGESWGEYMWDVPKVGRALGLTKSPVSTRRSSVTGFPLP